VALTLLCAAFCLRTWRRNGVACDELLFLPGSMYAKNNSSHNGSRSTLHRSSRLANRLPLNLRNVQAHADDSTNVDRRHLHTNSSLGSTNQAGGGVGSLAEDAEELSKLHMASKAASYDRDGFPSDIDGAMPTMEMVPLTGSSDSDRDVIANQQPPDESVGSNGSLAAGIEMEMEIESQSGSQADDIGASSSGRDRDRQVSLWRRIACRSQNFLFRRQPSFPHANPHANTAPDSAKRTPSFAAPSSPPSHPQHASILHRTISGGVAGFIAKFFSSSSEEYAPSGPAVASASLDLCIPVLFNFHLFIMATNYAIPDQDTANNLNPNDNDAADVTETIDIDDDDDTDYSIPPQVLPILFLSILYVRAILPPKSRRRFWGTIKSAIISPFKTVTFRDELIAEVLTSLVRPMQDITFAIFYWFASIYFILSGKVDLEDTGQAIGQSMLLHNFLLPVCAVIPLFCRFLQTLRQAYDDQQRWPHLGNAFKYLSSSVVIIYGLTHAEGTRHIGWHFGFVACVIYQIWWDVFVDWELLVAASPSSPNAGFRNNANNDASNEAKDEVVFLESNVAGTHSLWGYCCNRYLARLDLRPQRLFKSKRIYWNILIINFCIRFCWMLAFIPAFHWNTRTGNMETTSSVDTKNIMSFLISLAELLRRCCWVILRLELETIRLTDREYSSSCGNPYYSSSINTNLNGNGIIGWSNQVQYKCLMPSGDGQSSVSPIGASSSSKTHTMAMKWTAYRLLSKKLFCLELFVWIVTYLVLLLCFANLG